MTLTTPAPPPLPDELERLARRLRLPYLRKAAPEVLATARAQRWDPAEVVRVLLIEEAAGRDKATIRMRRRASGLPAGKTFDVWDQAASAVPAATQHSLRTLEWLGRAENLCLCGPSGAGKSHLVEALGHLAIDQGKTVAWHTLESLDRARSPPPPRRHRLQSHRPTDPRRSDRDRRRRHAPGFPRGRRSALPRRRRRLRDAARWRSPATCTPPALTS